MNSNQRRQANKKWRQKNEREIKKVLAWMQTAPDYAVQHVSNVDIQEGVLQARPPTFAAFGGSFTKRGRVILSKDEWVHFLSERGVRVPTEEP